MSLTVAELLERLEGVDGSKKVEVGVEAVGDADEVTVGDTYVFIGENLIRRDSGSEAEGGCSG